MARAITVMFFPSNHFHMYAEVLLMKNNFVLEKKKKKKKNRTSLSILDKLGSIWMAESVGFYIMFFGSEHWAFLLSVGVLILLSFFYPELRYFHCYNVN